MGAAGNEARAVGEAFRPVAQLLDQALTPGAEVGLRGEVALLERVVADVKEQFLAGLAFPDVLVLVA